MKIVLINHTFQINYFSRRWKLFADSYPDVEVYLLAPSRFKWYGKGYSFGNDAVRESEEYDEGNIHRRVYRVKDHNWGWTSPDFRTLFKEIQPDIIYYLGFHTQLSLAQVIHIKNRVVPNAKMLAFSMRGPYHDLHLKIKGLPVIKKITRTASYLISKRILSIVNHNCDAIFCHYPDALDCFRKEGYKGPIYMQTQVGVNTEWFHPDEDARKEIREKYSLGNSYVFGSATRFTRDKGIFEIIKALPKEGDWKFLMMGSGSQEQEKELREEIAKDGLQDKIILTGFVDWYDMAKYWNAVDCAVHVPRTTPTWIETFSLSVVQPMATKKPVIGNTSGSVPYQVGFNEMIVPEGDIKALHDKLKYALNNKEEMTKWGEKMYERTMRSFTVNHLNKLFYDTIVEDVLPGKYDLEKVDMTKYVEKQDA